MIKKPPEILRIACLHVAPIPGDLAHNQRLVETGLTVAARFKADWVLTPELCTCGYAFAERIGTDWIAPQPDAWMRKIQRISARFGLVVFLSHPERDPQDGRCYNAVSVFDHRGICIGKHRKISVIPGSESWATPGVNAVPLPTVPLKAGVLICADAYPDTWANRLKTQGAQLLVSPAAWGPGLYGPNGEWEQRTCETGLPLVVCNRTGKDVHLDFTDAESAVIKMGERLLSFTSPRSTVLIFDWDLIGQRPVSPAYQRIPL
ncbi:MAG: carbon-nitrogen hydrolase family protein [Gemmatimonadetes bacterium]|nr:carbon-nitrogen hydrolase family protein [Gemmatimonadota bacterium]